jgi:hypothetical protein
MYEHIICFIKAEHFIHGESSISRIPAAQLAIGLVNSERAMRLKTILLEPKLVQRESMRR